MKALVEEYLKKIAYSVFPAVILLCIFYKYFFGDSFLFGFAEWYSPYSLAHLKDVTFNYLFLYNSFNWGVPAFYPVIIIYQSVFAFLSQLFSLMIAQKIIIFCIFYFSFLSSYLVFKQFSKEKRLSYLLALLFAFNPFLLNHFVFGHLVLLVNSINLLFSVYFLLKFFDNKNTLNLVFTIFFFSVNPIHPLYIPFYGIFYILVCVYKQVALKESLKKLLLIFAGFALLHSFWLINLLLNTNAFNEVVTYKATNIDKLINQSKPIINSFLNSEYFNKNRFLNNDQRSQSFYDISSFILWSIFAALISIFNKKRLSKVYFSLLGLTLGLMLLLSGYFNPFGPVFLDILNRLMVFRIYREVYHFTFLLIPVVFVMLAFLTQGLKTKGKYVVSFLLAASLLFRMIALQQYSQFSSFSTKIDSWTKNNLDENEVFYNNFCKTYKTSEYVLFVPFYNTTKDIRVKNENDEGGADLLLSSSCVSSVGNSVTLNKQLVQILEAFDPTKTNEVIFKNLAIKYIVFRKDFLSGNEDQYSTNIFKERILKDNNFQLIEDSDSIQVFENLYNQGLIQSLNSTFQKINPTKYYLTVKKISKSQNLTFLQSFNRDWGLYLLKFNSSDPCVAKMDATSNECPPKKVFYEGDELSYLLKNKDFEASHRVMGGFANLWTIDPQYIKESFSKEYYKENVDGSIDIDLQLYYKPQSYFYLGILIFGSFVTIGFSYLLYRWSKLRYLFQNYD